MDARLKRLDGFGKGRGMQDFTEYSYSIDIDKLEQTVKEAVQGGCNVTVIINGEYYDINMDKAEKGRKGKR